MNPMTAKDIVNRAAALLGLGAVDSPYSSDDPNFIQLRAMLASAGADLVREHEWAFLRRQYDFQTETEVDEYPMPVDFLRHVNQTQWNRSSRLPLGGPVTPQGWQLLKTLNVVAAVQMFFRTKGARIYLHPVPDGIYQMALEYISAHWVLAPDGSGEPLLEPTDDDQLCLLDGQMLVHRLRRDFCRAKGFDSTAATEDYERALSLAKGSTEASPVLNLNHSPYNRARLLDGSNLPPTGFGGV